jgi:hypothetical protein
VNKVENEHLKPYKNNFIIFLGEISVTVSMVWVQIPSREEQKFDSSKI